jgi:hypothetical protein
MSEKKPEVFKALQPTEQKMPETAKRKRPMNFKGTLMALCESLNGPIGVAGFVFVIAVAYFGAIEWRVNLMVRDPEFVAKVARRARPAIVFDAERRLLSDSGAYRFLEDVPEVKLNVIDKTVNSGLETPYAFTKIIVRPKVPLASAPIVEALDSGDVSVKAEQIPGTPSGIDWEIRIEARAINITANGGPVLSLAPYRYRLEIIPPSDAP